MKKFIVVLMLLWWSQLPAYEIDYACFNEAKLYQGKRALPKSGSIESGSWLSYEGAGDIYIYFPCGATKLIESVAGERHSIVLKRDCTDQNPFLLAIKTFIKEFNNDDTYRIAASSRSGGSKTNEERYLVLEGLSQTLDIPVLDEDSVYRASVKCIDNTRFEHSEKGTGKLSIDLSRFPVGKECIVDVFEEAYMIGNLNVLVERLDNLAGEDNVIEALARYVQKTNRKVVYSETLKAMMK